MTSRERCNHPELESLGSDHDAMFLVCRQCRSVLVQQGSITLAIPPAPSAPPPAK